MSFILHNLLGGIAVFICYKIGEKFILPFFKSLQKKYREKHPKKIRIIKNPRWKE